MDDPAYDSKKRRREWVQYERTHSNSMWHTGYKRLDDGRWFIVYQDDASRMIVGYGVFAEATGEHALEVLEKAIRDYGRPASIVTARGSQFYASEREAEKGGASEFEKRLVELGIRHLPARTGNSHTNGKLARLYGELRKLDHFKDVAGPPGTGCPIGAEKPEADPIARFVRWYNHIRPHSSLDWDKLEVPAQAFVRKMPGAEDAAEPTPK